MKFYFPLLLAALISFTAVAQKKELKAAQKLVDASLYEKALVALNEMQPLIDNAEAKNSSHYYYLLGISKQKKLQHSAWSRFKEFLNIFLTVTDFL